MNGLHIGVRADLVCCAGFIAIFALPFLVYLGLLTTRAIRPTRSHRHGAGQRLLHPLFIGFYYWFLGPVFRIVGRSFLSPNVITGAALFLSACTAVAIATGHFGLASAFLIGSGTLDIIDGHVARIKNLATAAGAFLDSTIDRISDGLVFGGCAVYYANTPMMYVALVVLITSYTISYSRARGEALGLKGSEGLMQRADRIVVLGAALAVAPFFGHHGEGSVPHPFYTVAAGALCLLAVLNSVTAVSRIVWSMRTLTDSRQNARDLDGRFGGHEKSVAGASRPVVSSLHGEAPPVVQT